MKTIDGVVIGSKAGVLIQIVAALLLTAVLLAVIEFAAHFVVMGSPPRDQKREPEDDPVARTLAWLEINPVPLVRDVDLLWRNEPGAHKTQPVNPRVFGRDESWTIENNSEGFRGPERARDGQRVYRILCVGDSVTFGFNVDQPDVYPRRLEELLAERYPGRRFEVINAGVPGWSWLQGLRFVETRGLALRPDMLIIGHGTNDQMFRARITDEERFKRLEGPMMRALQSTGVFLSQTNTYRLLERVFPAKPPADEDSPRCRQQIRSTGVCHRVSLDQIAASVREIGRIARREGMDVLVVNLDFAGTPAVEGARAGVTRDDLPFLDVVAAMKSLRNDDEDARGARLHLAPASRNAPDTRTPQGAAPAKSILLRVLVPEKAREYRVGGKSYIQPNYTFEERMYDDGTHGDEVAGDGVFSISLQIPAAVNVVVYKFYQGEVAEFMPLPPIPSQNGDRLLAVKTDTVGPVDVFGESLFMAERAHPNRDGDRMVAEVVARKLEELPTYAAFIAAAASAGAVDPVAADR